MSSALSVDNLFLLRTVDFTEFGTPIKVSLYNDTYDNSFVHVRDRSGWSSLSLWRVLPNAGDSHFDNYTDDRMFLAFSIPNDTDGYISASIEIEHFLMDESPNTYPSRVYQITKDPILIEVGGKIYTSGIVNQRQVYKVTITHDDVPVVKYISIVTMNMELQNDTDIYFNSYNGSHTIPPSTADSTNRLLHIFANNYDDAGDCWDDNWRNDPLSFILSGYQGSAITSKYEQEHQVTPGFITEMDSNGSPIRNRLPLNTDLYLYNKNNSYPAIYKFTASFNDPIRRLCVDYGFVFSLNYDYDTTNAGLAWSKASVDNYKQLTRFDRFKTYDPNIYEEFFGYIDSNQEYTQYCRIMYTNGNVIENVIVPPKMSFSHLFPLAGGDSPVITWRTRGYDTFVTNSTGTGYEFNQGAYSQFETGYIVQFDTSDCLNTVNPLVQTLAHAGVANMNKELPRKTNYLFPSSPSADLSGTWRDLTTSGDSLVQLVNDDGTFSNTATLVPGDYEVRLTGSGILSPTFESTKCINTMCVGLWINEDKVRNPHASADIQIGDTVILPIYDSSAHQPMNTFYENSQTDDTMTVSLAYPVGDNNLIETHVKVFDTAPGRIKVGVWVKVEPWIYDGYWKPAPSAIQLNENLNEDKGWSKSIS